MLSPQHVESNLALLHSGEYSDMILRSSTDEYHLHRSFVCTRSEVIKTTFEGDFNGTEQGVMPLTDEVYDPAAVTRVVAYLYQDDYDDGEFLPPHEPVRTMAVGEPLDDDPEACVLLNEELASRMIANVGVFWLADFLNIQDLKAKAEEKFKSAAQLWSATPIEDLPPMIDAIWNATSEDDTGLRNPILKKCAPLYEEITMNDVCVQSMNENGAFGVGMVKAVASYHEDLLEVIQRDKKLTESELVKQKYSKRRHYFDIKNMNYALQRVNRELDRMAEKRLDTTKEGKVIGKNGKMALKLDLYKIRNQIEPYTKCDVGLAWHQDGEEGRGFFHDEIQEQQE